MARRKAQGPSVSFFAFQDIITSVVGIFVLITLIMMVELVTRKASASGSNQAVEDTFSAVIVELQQQYEALEARSAKLDTMAKKIGSVQVFNRDEVTKELQASIQSLNEQLERTERRNQEIQRVIDEQKKLQSDLQMEVKNRSPDREELEKLRKDLEKLDTRLAKLNTQEPLIYKSQSLDGRNVVVLEITSSEIAILDLAGDTRVTLRGRYFAGEFKDWMRKQTISRNHFFLLIRPGGSDNFQQIREVLDNSKASYGYDVLDMEKSLQLRSEAMR